MTYIIWKLRKISVSAGLRFKWSKVLILTFAVFFKILFFCFLLSPVEFIKLLSLLAPVEFIKLLPLILLIRWLLLLEKIIVKFSFSFTLLSVALLVSVVMVFLTFRVCPALFVSCILLLLSLVTPRVKSCKILVGFRVSFIIILIFLTLKFSSFIILCSERRITYHSISIRNFFKPFLGFTLVLIWMVLLS